jgi:hypothetical protein
MNERPEISSLYFEAEAAKRIGVEPRALRSERVAGRIMDRIDG